MYCSKCCSARSRSYVAYVKQDNNYSIYINSSATGNLTTLASQVTDSGPHLPNTVGWNINGRGVINGTPAQEHGGLIDELRLSDTALGPSQLLVALPFPGVPGTPTCVGQTLSFLVQNDGGSLAAAAKALNFASVKDLQSAVNSFCKK
jgi:hypothetical protein